MLFNRGFSLLLTGKILTQGFPLVVPVLENVKLFLKIQFFSCGFSDFLNVKILSQGTPWAFPGLGNVKKN